MLPLIALLFFFQSSNYRAAMPPHEPPFQQYPAVDAITGSLALPRLSNAEERRFRTILRRAITKGYYVVDGGTEHQRAGANFAGRYVLVQWGCGTECIQAALIDGKDVEVLRLPQIPGQERSDFSIPTGSLGPHGLEFRWNSRLLGIPCIPDGMTYYYLLDGHHWRYISKNKTPEDRDEVP
jgi:hypothetical protein